VVCVVAAGAAVAFLLTSQPGDVSHPGRRVHRHAGHEPTSTQREPKATEHPMDDGFAWPTTATTRRARATCRSRRRCARRS
jgi:hypothetical protein